MQDSQNGALRAIGVETRVGLFASIDEFSVKGVTSS
jgi:hypothetical protein